MLESPKEPEDKVIALTAFVSKLAKAPEAIVKERAEVPTEAETAEL